MFVRVLLAMVCCFLLLPGCGAQESYRQSAPNVFLKSANPADSSPNELALADDAALGEPKSNESQQRIIYTASISLVVKDFATTKQEIDRLLKQTNGFIANFQEDRIYGDQRHGHWVVRVPVTAFHGFTTELASLGVAESQSINGQDVTEEFVDLEARLKNQRVLEERIIKLLDDRTGDIKDIIAVEEQLARVRGEIERMEGRLRYLKDRTSLTTVTIDVREDKTYVPPAPPTLASRVASSWTGSLGGLQKFAENALVVVVALVPWAFVLLVVLVPFSWYLRRRFSIGKSTS